MFAATVFVSLLAVVSAVPTAPQGNVCGNGQNAVCCNSATAENTLGGLLALNLKDLIAGGQCNDLGLNVLAVDLKSDKKCLNSAYCCNNVQQVGLVNTACTPIQVL